MRCRAIVSDAEFRAMEAANRCFGTVPGRNTVVWEVRCDTGRYERSAWGDFDRPTRFDGG